MIDPRTDYERKLAELNKAGPAGVAIDLIGVGTALHLQMHGLAVFHQEAGRAVITSQGRAHLQRQVWS